MSQTIDLKTLNEEQLKAFAYDRIVQRDLLNQELSMIAQELNKRSQVANAPAEPKEGNA